MKQKLTPKQIETRLVKLKERSLHKKFPLSKFSTESESLWAAIDTIRSNHKRKDLEQKLCLIRQQNELTEKEIVDEFFRLRECFLNGKLSLSFFSAECSLLWISACQINPRCKNLEDILVFSMDLDYYFKEDRAVYDDWLKKIKEF